MYNIVRLNTRRANGREIKLCKVRPERETIIRKFMPLLPAGGRRMRSADAATKEFNCTIKIIIDDVLIYLLSIVFNTLCVTKRE